MVLLCKCKIYLKLSKIVISNRKLPNKVSIYMFGEVRNSRMLKLQNEHYVGSYHQVVF